MSPNMRSIFAQVHRKSVSMGSRRDFSSSAASSEWNVALLVNNVSFANSVGYGLCVWASSGMYRVYKYYYPKLLICQEEYKRRVEHQHEVWAQVKEELFYGVDNNKNNK